MRPLLLSASLALLASCATKDQKFAAACERSSVGGFGSGAHYVASHDFGTTDPGTLARVVAYVPEADSSTIAHDPSAGPITGGIEAPTFQGSVAVVPCMEGSTVEFELLP